MLTDNESISIHFESINKYFKNFFKFNFQYS